MGGKFSTTSSSLFNNNNASRLPDWMKDLESVEVKDNGNMDLGIESKGVFAEKQTVYREDKVGTPRYLEASFNETRLITDAKIQLAKFLSGKYYESDPKVVGNNVIVDVRIANIPGSFKFAYKVAAGKLSQDTTFFVTTEEGDAEYPFSKAGFEECVADVKSKKVKTARKVLSGNPSMITLEEIVRRFNGDHRAAMDKARELVEAQDIIGVGSNTYASMYSMDDLFPAMEKEACEERLPEFHFAPNQEHVAANPRSSAKVLSIEASKTLAELFSDFIIRLSDRDDNELLVKADVMTEKGVLENADFCFGIENDRIASVKFVEFRNERITVDQMLAAMNRQSNVLDAYLRNNPTTAKRIYRGVVLTAKEIHRRLHKIANKDTVGNIIENWVERGLITPVNSTTFTTTASFEDLLSSVNTKVLTADEAAEITAQQRTFGAGLDFDRQDVQDTGFRNDHEIEASENIRLANLYNEVSKHFKNFEIMHFDGRNGILAFHIDSGRTPVFNLDVEFEGNAIKRLEAGPYDSERKVISKLYSLDKLASTIYNSPALSRYVEDNPGKKFVAASVISMSNLRRALANVIKAESMDHLINAMIKDRNLINIGGDMYASKYPISKLLVCNLDAHLGLLSEEDRAEIKAAKAHFGRALEREAVIDTGVRDMDVTASEEQILNSANGYLAQHFANFQSKGFAIEGDNMSYVVSLFDPTSGLRTDVNFMFEMNGVKVANCGVVVGNEVVSLANVKQVFAQNDVLKKYLEVHAGNRVEAPMIMTVEKLVKKLASVTGASLQEIEDTVVHWHKLGKISQIGSNAFASRYTVEQLLSMSNLKALSDTEFKERIARAQREKLAKVSAAHIKDNDTRALVDEWSADRLMVFAKTELNKIYHQYDIIDVKLTDDRFEVAARVTSNGMRSKFTMAWAVDNGKPTHCVSSSGIKAASKEVQAFTDLNTTGGRVGKGLISKGQLRNKLASVIDINKFDEVTATLEELGMLKAIDSNTFASEYSMSEMVERLAAFNKTNLEAGKDQRRLAGRDEGSINMPTTVVMNTGSRVVEAQEKSLSPKMTELRNKMAVNIDKAHTGKLITARKHEQFKSELAAASTEKDLENVWKEFKKYLG